MEARFSEVAREGQRYLEPGECERRPTPGSSKREGEVAAIAGGARAEPTGSASKSGEGSDVVRWRKQTGDPHLRCYATGGVVTR